MDRRRLLVSTASSLSAAAAGCLGSGEPGTSTSREPTDPAPATDGEPPTTSAAPGPGYSLSVEDIGVFRRTTTIQHSNHVDVAADPETQYVVATVVVLPPETGEPAEDPPNPTDRRFVATLDGETYDDAFATEFGSQYATTIAVPVPTGLDPAEGTLQVGHRGEDGFWHQFTAEQLDRIAHVPRFTLDAFTVEAGNATVQATLEVSNSGDRDGRFLAELGTNDISDTPEVSFEVPAGETVTKRESVAIYAEDAAEVTVVCNWGDTYHRRTVEV
ncbi:hypothetical protein [Haloarchaeobius sp. DT45]|uniref:hypothetical protein n=1 Tax=Haloarchaeobius sp. DT45 TaxID=3446116 RepID=UPI003F6B12C5